MTAHDLLNQWMTDKLDFNTGEALDEDVYVRRKPSEAQVKREWDHLLEDLGEELTPRQSTSQVFKPGKNGCSPYH